MGQSQDHEYGGRLCGVDGAVQFFQLLPWFGNFPNKMGGNV
jgi:hypothetical protein